MSLEKLMRVAAILDTLAGMANQRAAMMATRYFKAIPGGYGEGDRFLGIRMPQLRQLARHWQGEGTLLAPALLKSGIHEARMLALLMLVNAFTSGNESLRGKIFRLYIKNSRFINNWDLIDVSAPTILGGWLFDKDKSLLEKMAQSASAWERRMAILATFHFIKQGEYRDALRVARLLVKDENDLVQKAVGWMLREIGSRIGEDKAESFLKRHYTQMPRTMLRTAIEHFEAGKRKRYLTGGI